MSTYTPIASIVSSGNASSVSFVGVPQFYTDLVLNISAKHSSIVQNHRLRFNNDSSSSYADLRIFGTGSSMSADSRENQTWIMLGEISTGQFGADKWYIPQYTNTSMHKRVIGRSGNIGGNVQAGVSEYRSYNPITEITVTTDSGNFVNGSVFNLYGIAAGSTKASGGLVTTDGTYWYHTFNTSSKFVAHEAITVDYLVVAGGGGGSGANGGADAGNGGGGAGGLRCTVGTTGGSGSVESALALTANTTHTVLVGAGGTGGLGGVATTDGINGSDSVFSTITALGGSGGNDGGGSATTTGGSGGGAGAGASNRSLGTSNQGFDGGTSSANSGGGGGGAGSVGGNASSNTGGTGGTGRTISISGSSVAYAGGGGGGGRTTGGGTASGGGNGGDGNAAGSAGVANRGGGGGGAGGILPSGTNSGGAGGSGVVIVRYAV